MKTITAFVASLAASLALPAFAEKSPPPPTVIHAGELLETPGQAPRAKVSVIVLDGKVKEVRPGFVSAHDAGLADDARVIDLSNMFVMPGFIDLHVHLASAGGGSDLRLRQPDEYFALAASRNAQAVLMGGFTTVRDLGSVGYQVLGLRNAIRDGLVQGPRILASGDPISPTNGHADNHGYREEVMAATVRRGVCNGADDCRRAVRAAVQRGADVIKVMASGGALDESDAPTDLQFTDEELKAIADTAHVFGRKVTAHAHGKGAIDACIRAGFDSIEHGMWADAETLKTMKARHIWLIPTVYAIDYVGTTPEAVRRGPMRNLPPVSLAKVIALGDQPKKLVRQAIAIGTPVALGTDAPIFPFGQNAHEFLEYAEGGMTPMQALVAGTSDAARAGGIKNVGTLEPGMSADIVAMPTSPLKDINAVLNVPFVMARGDVVKQDGRQQLPDLAPPSAGLAAAEMF